MVVVDGFDPNDNRTQESIFEDFGDALLQYLELGFDLVVVDYQNGRDYIQRNGLAIRRLLVDQIPNWLSSSADPRIVMIGGSMGSQTGRYALTTAEQAGEDHGVRLFFAVDGPFRGANIPISMQLLSEFFAFNAGFEVALEGLNSPAASQQLRRNRFFDPSQSEVNGLNSNVWYVPRQEYIDYYDEVIPLGLPNDSRNVGIASGSGVGSTQYGFSGNPNPQGLLNKLDYVRKILGVVVGRLRLRVRTDYSTEIFDGLIKNPLCNTGPGICFKRVRVNLSNGVLIDTAPGGFRDTPVQIRDLWNSNDDSVGEMVIQRPFHNFVPTFSALNINTSNLYYNPSTDPNVLSRSGFDSIWYEKCNEQHVDNTDGLSNIVATELIAFLNNTIPQTPPELPVNQCNNPEPGDPVAVCDMYFDLDGPSDPRVVDFDATGSFDPNGNIVSYSWDFDDGSPLGSGSTTTHTYTGVNGLVYPILTVTDNEGNTRTTSCGTVPVGLDI